MNDKSPDMINIVIDIGSSSIRAVAFTPNGHVFAARKREYDTKYPRLSWAEQDPRDWETATIDSLSELMLSLPKGIKINGLSFTGQCPSYIPVDNNFQPLGNVLTYQDNRSIKEAEYLISLVGNDYIHQHSGHSIEPFFILPKLLWHKVHDPSLYSKIHKVLQPCDFLEYFLTGYVSTDFAYASGTLAYDLLTGDWNYELLKKLAIDENIFPEKIHNSWDVVGVVKNEIADKVGLPRNVPVIRGGPDSQCCSLGVNAIDTNVLSNMSGTSTCLNRTVKQPIQDLRVGNYAHVIPDRWSAEVGLNTTGVSLKKVAKILFSDLDEQTMYEQVKNCVQKSPAGSNGLLFFPYLSDGERDNQNIKGGFYNFNMLTQKEDVVRAVMEGVAFAEKERAELLNSPGESFAAMRISGGGASLDIWNQIKADVMNMPVSALRNADAAELGASILINVGTGVCSNYSSAISECDLHYDELLPDAQNVKLYEEKYARFLEFEESIAPKNN